MSLTNRIGCFFMLVGGVVLVLFLASDAAGQQNCSLLLLGILGAVLGFIMWRRNRPEPPSSGRFTTFQKLRQRSSKKKAEPPK
jgi:hypothetical protein